MNLNVGEASLYVHKLGGVVKRTRDVEVVIAPTLLALQPVSLQIHRHDFKLAAQDFYWRDDGAFTGEVSASQLRGLVQYGVVGHSERRHVFHESSKDIRSKVQAAFRNNFVPILCVGETAGERATGETNDIIHDQLVAGLSNITSDEVSRLVVAYEPVWAIGTGNHPTPTDIEAAVKAIRSQIRHLFGAEPSKKVRILYGGSVTADNATSYMQIPGVDGLFVGGASLNLHTFADIVNQAHAVTTKGKK